MENTSVGSDATKSNFDVDGNDLWQWIVYAVQGAIMVVTNAIVFFAFCKHSAWQKEKEFILIAGLSLADCLNGFGYVSAGVDRSIQIFAGTHNVKVSAWDCLLVPHNVIWLGSDVIATFMLLAISIDRLLSAVFLIKYLGWSRRYAIGLLLIGYGYGIGWGSVGVFTAYQQPPDRIYPRLCYSEYATGHNSRFYPIQYLLNVCVLISSVCCYFVVWVVYRLYYAKAVQRLNPSEKDLKQRAAEQRRMTAAMAISNLFTFIFCVIPYLSSSIIAAYYMNNKFLMWWTIVSWIVYNINPMLNLFIYVRRHRAMQMGIKALFVCKEMPPNISSWKTQTTNANRSHVSRNQGHPTNF